MTKNQWHCAADSITAGCSSTILGHPLDTIKVHQQTNKHLSKKVDVLFITRTLYSGHVAHLAREGVFTMAYLGLYDRITNAIRNRSTVVSDGDVKNNLPLVMQQLSI
ncbi:hypothetical protein ACHAXN_013424 [Cyclotella atomus]